MREGGLSWKGSCRRCRSRLPAGSARLFHTCINRADRRAVPSRHRPYTDHPGCSCGLWAASTGRDPIWSPAMSAPRRLSGCLLAVLAVLLVAKPCTGEQAAVGRERGAACTSVPSRRRPPPAPNWRSAAINKALEAAWPRAGGYHPIPLLPPAAVLAPRVAAAAAPSASPTPAAADPPKPL